MTTVMTVTEFDDDVSEYKVKENELAKTFIMGVLTLGEILFRQRSKWKPNGKWLDYLGKIGKHISGANQMIRLYEYSVENKKDLIKLNLTNWNKVNLFLALPDEVKEKLGVVIDGREVTTDEFRESVSAIKIEETGVLQTPEELKDVTESFSVAGSLLAEAIEDVTIEHPEFSSKEVLKRLQESSPFLTDNSEGAVTAYLSIVKAIAFLDKCSKLNEVEKDFWKGRISMVVMSLGESYKNNLV